MTDETTTHLLLTPAEAADELRLGLTMTRRLLRNGSIPSFRIGRARRVSRLALEQWIAAQGSPKATTEPSGGT